MRTYLQLGQELLDKFNRRFRNRQFRPDRTNTGTVSVFGRQVRYDLRDGFPLLTTKKMFLRGVIEELLWILSGSSDNNVLAAKNVHIWDEWATETGALGPIYGPQWRSWPDPSATIVRPLFIAERFTLATIQLAHNNDLPYDIDDLERVMRLYGLQPGSDPLEYRADDKLVKKVHQLFTSWGVQEVVVEEKPIDQIARLIESLKTKPYSRRHIVSAWNPADLPDESISPQDNVRVGKACLASCHTLFQFYVEDLLPEERIEEAVRMGLVDYQIDMDFAEELMDQMDRDGVPRKRLDCLLYQR